jgi:anti-anti-sigma factor
VFQVLNLVRARHRPGIAAGPERPAPAAAAARGKDLGDTRRLARVLDLGAMSGVHVSSWERAGGKDRLERAAARARHGREPYDRPVEALELLDDPSGVRVIVLTGEHDLSSAGALRLAFAGAREAGRGVVVELSIVSFVDSTILGAIVEALRECKEEGRGFAVVASNRDDETVPRLLGMTGLRAVFPVYESRAMAIERAAAGLSTPA